MVARAARSLQSLPTIGIACETRGTRRSLRVSRRRFQLSTGCWNLYAVPVLFERKTMETMEPSRFLAIELAPICIYPERRFCLSLVSSFIVPVCSIVAILARGKKANMRFRGSVSRNAWKYWCMQLAGRVKKKLYLQYSIILNHLNCYLLAIS